MTADTNRAEPMKGLAVKTLQLKIRPGSARYAAAVAGSPAYSTGKPCRRGHLAERRTSNGMCSACQAEWRSANKGAASTRAYKARNRVQIRARNNEIYRLDRTARPWRIVLMFARDRARDKGLPFALTTAWGEANWTGHCAITGLAFVMDHGLKHNHPFSASLDRIDQALGYIEGNCRFVLSAVNSFRGLMTDAQMLVVAQAIVSGPCAGTNGSAARSRGNRARPKTKVEANSGEQKGEVNG